MSSDQMAFDLVCHSYWMLTEISLSKSFKTSRGSRIKVVNVCVDVEYDVVDGRILLLRAALAKSPVNNRRCHHPARSVEGHFSNVYSPHTGEEWHTEYLDGCSEHQLWQALRKEQKSKYGWVLRNKMIEGWAVQDRCPVARDFIDAINLQLPAEMIDNMIKSSQQSKRVRLNYAKGLNLVLSRRDVTLLGVILPESINPAYLKLIDNKDDVEKTFRLERVFDVEPEVPYRRR